MDLSTLASNLPQIAQQLAPLAGALAGGGSSAGRAGALAAIGDHQHEMNQRTYEGVKQFADQLEKMGMDTENWDEPTREAIMHERMNLLSPKTISKIYSNPGAADKLMAGAWENIRNASARPVDSQQQAYEKNAAASAIPALGGLQTAAGGVQAATDPSVLGMLGGGAGGGVSDAMGAMAQDAGAQISQNQNVLQQPPSQMRYGPLTPGEKSARSFAAIQPFLGGGSSGSGAASPGGAANMHPVVGIHGGKAALTMRPGQIESKIFVDPADAHGLPHMVHRDKLDPSGQFYQEDGTPVPQTWVETGKYGLTSVQELHPDGTVTTDRQNKLTPGQTISPQSIVMKTTSDNDGRTHNVVMNRGGKVLSDSVIGSAAFAYDKKRGILLSNDSKALRNDDLANNLIPQHEFNLKGSYYDAKQGAIVVPPNTPTDEETGQVIPPMVFKLTKPTTAQAMRGSVAGDSIFAADMVLKKAKAAESQFGPLEGKTVGYLTEHGIISDPDIKALQVAMFSLSETQPQVHAMRNYAMALHAAEVIGDSGQPYENFVKAITTLKEFLGRVEKTGKTSPYAVSPGSVRPVTRTPKPAGSNVAAPPSTQPAGSNMQTLQAIAKLLGGQ